MIRCQDGCTDLPQERLCLLPLPLLEALTGACLQSVKGALWCPHTPARSLSRTSTGPEAATQMWRATSCSAMKALRAIWECGLALPQTASLEEWNSDLSQSLDTFFIMITSKHMCLLSTDLCFDNNDVSVRPSKEAKFTPCCRLVFEHQRFSNKHKVEAQLCPSPPVWFGPLALPLLKAIFFINK